jgi:segregation and condensation protein B
LRQVSLRQLGVLGALSVCSLMTSPWQTQESWPVGLRGLIHSSLQPMSLKAKIEAVIYASEEPVTLAQLTGLLGEEGQAELDALESQQQSLALDENPAGEAETVDQDALIDQDALNAETLDESEVSSAETPDEPVEEPAVTGEVESVEAQPVEPEPAPETAPATELPAEPSAEVPAESPVEDKKLTRERERKLRDYFRSLLDQLISDYVNNDRGLEIREVAGGFRLATKPEYHDAVRGFVKSLKPPLKLSLQALETLAVVAYKQPVTAPEVSEIRGVDSGGVLGSLMARKLVTTAGRKQVIGRPILYKTTKDFLVRFGLKDINELPSIEEFEKMAGELADSEPVQEEIPMDDVNGGTPSSLDEANSTPEPTSTLHESVEELISDDSTKPEGHNLEHADTHEVEPLVSEPVPEEPVHVPESEPQADGDSSDED